MNGCNNISNEYSGCYQDQSCIDCLSSYNCWSDNLTISYAYCPADCQDKCFIEPVVADKVLSYFKDYTTNDALKQNPFFIGVGFQRPHLAFDAPTRSGHVQLKNLKFFSAVQACLMFVTEYTGFMICTQMIL